MKAQLYFLIILNLVFLGCSPNSESNHSKTQKEFPEFQTEVAQILSRDLLYKNDQRINYCEIIENDKTTYSGFRDTDLVPLASISKVITSAWAIDRLGSDFRFNTEVYLKEIDPKSGLFDAYISTKYDPIMDIEKLLHILSELKSTTGVLVVKVKLENDIVITKKVIY